MISNDFRAGFDDRSRIFYIDGGDNGTDSPNAIRGLQLIDGDVSGDTGPRFSRIRSDELLRAGRPTPLRSRLR